MLADLQGRAPSGGTEAEIWFGDHPGDPAETPDGRTLDRWIEEDGADSGVAGPLPYLLKLLAAGSALSIQAHPSKAQAEVGFAREEAAGIPRDAGDRTYRDDNHKPELIVAISPTFRALAGLRDLERTRRLVECLGSRAQPLADRLAIPDVSLAEVIGWLLTDGAGVAADVVAAALEAQRAEFEPELTLARELHQNFPGDPGIAVALLMNLVTLQRGDGLFVPAGVLHAYLEGLGVELMAASDNVLRGGLTPKHIDAAELVSVLDAAPGAPNIVRAGGNAEGIRHYDVPITDFALSTATVNSNVSTTLPVNGASIVLVTSGSVTVRGTLNDEPVTLKPGQGLLATPDEQELQLSGSGEAFVARPGR